MTCFLGDQVQKLTESLNGSKHELHSFLISALISKTKQRCNSYVCCILSKRREN